MVFQGIRQGLIKEGKSTVTPRKARRSARPRDD